MKKFLQFFLSRGTGVGCLVYIDIFLIKAIQFMTEKETCIILDNGSELYVQGNVYEIVKEVECEIDKFH